MKRRPLLAALVALLPALVIGAPAVAQTRVSLSGYAFPSTANVQGAFNALFKTRVVLTNTNSYAINVLVGIATPGGAMSHTLNLAGSSVYVYENFLGEVFGYTGGAGIGMRSLDGSAFLATAEVYAEGPNGRFSTPLPIQTELDKVVATSESGSSETIGFSSNASNRTNIGCANLGAVNATITVTSYVIGPGTQNVTTINLPAYTWYQQSFPLQGDLLMAYFRASATDSIGAYCWAVQVNNTSNDGTIYPARWRK